MRVRMPKKTWRASYDVVPDDGPGRLGAVLGGSVGCGAGEGLEEIVPASHGRGRIGRGRHREVIPATNIGERNGLERF